MLNTEQYYRNGWRFSWIGILVWRARIPAIKFALKNLWRAFRGYKLTVCINKDVYQKIER